MKSTAASKSLAHAENLIRLLQDELASTNRDVLLLTLDLDERVAERTAQLSAANRDLLQRASELEAARREADRANLAKNRFLANMSHELRTPLNGIIGFAEFILDGRPGPLNSKQQEYLGDILNSGRHLLQLINDVLDLAKVESGNMQFVPEKFSILAAISEACGVTAPMERERQLQIMVSAEPSLEFVTLDKQKFKQVLYNLLSNAIKFSDTGGRVHLTAHRCGADFFEISVTDTGIGIKPEDIPRLFREFEQLDSGADRQYEGTGLGLVLTREIVERQGGSISVMSAVGVGSTFTVVLPLAA